MNFINFLNKKSQRLLLLVNRVKARLTRSGRVRARQEQELQAALLKQSRELEALRLALRRSFEVFFGFSSRSPPRRHSVSLGEKPWLLRQAPLRRPVSIAEIDPELGIFLNDPWDF